ncbi:hypothetical protein WMF39_18555 [Sorangium sp. So ce1504]|uniref:hypothetical protein n=1 Tax=Sorangium sp. So ce1504 TaxID=3133337 RepID=UPI003F5F423F
MKSRLLAAMLALASLGGAQAAQAEEAELTAIVADVLARNPSLRAGALRRRAFQDEAAAAGAWPDPTVSVMLDRVPMGEEMPMIRYELSQMVPWPGKLDLTRRAVEQQENSAAAELAVRQRRPARRPGRSQGTLWCPAPAAPPGRICATC